MKLGNILNVDRVNALQVDTNAYVAEKNTIHKENKVNTQEIQKVIFPEPYENVNPYYTKNDFGKPPPPPIPENHKCNHNHNNIYPKPMFDVKSLLPMLMGGNFNDMLKPLMSMFGGGNSGSSGIGDISKIFELFKPKSKSKIEEKKEDEDISSKFDDMIIIED